MKFVSVTLENFSSYYGKHSITFNTTPEKPVAIIIGGTGNGKTSIFDAINWALYGSQYEQTLKDNYEKKILDYLNETALKDAIEGDNSIEMACTLFFEHDDIKYRIHQALRVKNNGKKNEITDQTSTLFKIHPTGNASEIPNIESFLNELLPNNVRDYFLFNGDRINQLSMPGSSEQIRDGIYRVVDLELLQNGAIHLEEVAKKFRRLAKSFSVGEVADVEEKYSAAYEALGNLKARLGELQDERRALEDNIEVVQAKLREMDSVKDLQKKRDVLTERYTNYQAKLKNTILEIRTTVSFAILELANPDIISLQAELNKKREKGEIPSSISENLLQDLLEIKKCICGTEFIDGDVIYAHLRDRLDQEKDKKKKGHDLLDLFYSLGAAKEEIDKASNRLPILEQNRVEFEQKLAEISKELGITLEKLKNQPEEEISKLADNLQEYNHDLTEIRVGISSINNKIMQKEDEIHVLQNKREELGSKQEKVRRYQLRDNLAQSSADELWKIFAKFSEDSRLEIQELTRREFAKFVPTATALTIGINSEFHYDVQDQNGRSALQQLSNGQKQALSLAYITSISRVSEKYPPLVIDMPFGRLDEDVQENIASSLPDLSSQVILLVLPGAEWNDRTKKIFSDRTSDVYQLIFNKELRQTTVEKVK